MHLNSNPVDFFFVFRLFKVNQMHFCELDTVRLDSSLSLFVFFLFSCIEKKQFDRFICIVFILYKFFGRQDTAVID